METSTGLNREEMILTDTESEEVDETFYMNRLLMLGTVGPLSDSPRSNPLSTYNKGSSPQIEVLVQRGPKRPLDNSQFDENSLIDSVRRDAISKADGNSAKVKHMKAQSVSCTTSCAESGNEKLCRSANDYAAKHNQVSNKTGPDAEGVERAQSSSAETQASSKVVTMAPINRRKHTSSTNLKSTVCSGQNVVLFRRSLRTLTKACAERCEGKQETKKSEVSKCKYSKNRCRPKTSDILSHPSRGGQQELEKKLHSSSVISSKAIKSPKTGKALCMNSIHKRNQFGETLLLVAAMKGDVKSVKDMIKTGASVNLADNAGWTPLHEAVLHNHYTVVETLLEAGADVNATGYKGVTPLQDAVLLGNLKTIELLLKHGADPFLKNESGEAPVDSDADMRVQELLAKYLPTIQRECLSESANKEPCSRATQTADKDKAKNKQESSDTVACVGPGAESAEKLPDSETRASLKGTSSVQTLLPLRDQAVDTSVGASLLVRDPLVLGTDTSPSKASDAESDVTVDYIEAHSSSPGHWFLSATQDFSGNICRLVGVTMNEEANTVHKDLHVSQSLVSADDESNLHQCKGLLRYSSENANKRTLDGSRGGHETLARKKMRRMTMSSRAKTFLDYLLNFDLSGVSAANNVSGRITKRGSDGSASPLNRYVSDYHSGPTVCQKGALCEDSFTSHTQSHLIEEGSISLLAPCKNEINKSNSKVIHSPVPGEIPIRSTDIGSPSLLIGLIHDQGLACSREPQVREKVLGQIKLTSDTLEMTHSSSHMSGKSFTAQSCFGEEEEKQTIEAPLNCANEPTTIDNSEWSQTNIDTLNNLTSKETVESSEETFVSTVLSFVKSHSQNDKLDIPTKQVQQIEDNEETQLSCSQAYVSPTGMDGMVNNKGQASGNSRLMLVETAPAGFSVFQANSSPPTSISTDQISTNYSRNTTEDPTVPELVPTLTCDKDGNAAVEEEEDTKCSADSDCTVIEDLQHLKTSEKDGEGVIIQKNLEASPMASTYYKEKYSKDQTFPVEQSSGEQIKNRADQPNTQSCVSILINLAQKPLCLLPAADNNRGTQSVQYNVQKAVKTKDASCSERCVMHRDVMQHKMKRKNNLRRTKNPSTSTNSINAATKQTLKITNKILHHRNGVGETYLHRACKKGDLSLVKLLIKAGINVNISDNAGWTALHEAVTAGYVDVVEQLLHAGADVNKAGLTGVIPLHYAVSFGQHEVVKLLLQYGANPHDKDALGKSALDLAEHESIRELLLTFKGPLVVPGELTESYKQESEIVTHEQMLLDNQVGKPPPSACHCEDDIERHVKDTPEDSVVCKETSIQLTLQEVEQKQKAMSVWMLREPEDGDRFADALLEIHAVLSDVFFKQQLEFHLSNNNRVTPDFFHEGKLNEYLLDLTSRQKHLLMLLQQQDELRHRLKVFTDQHCSSNRNSSTGMSELNDTLLTQFWTDCKESDCIINDHNYSKNSPLDLESRSVISNIAHPSLLSGRTETTNDSRTSSSLIEKGVDHPGDHALKLAQMDSCHKAFLLSEQGSKAFRVPKHSASSPLRTTDVSGKKVTCGSELLRDCRLSADTNGPPLKECALQPTCTGLPLESLTKEIFMCISSIHLISDEEFLPCSMMDKYWDLFIQSEDWAFEAL